MSHTHDPRVAELEAFAREEGITLPMPADMIVFLEKHGRIVCLLTGAVYSGVTVGVMPNAQAVAYLLGHEVGEIVVT